MNDQIKALAKECFRLAVLVERCEIIDGNPVEFAQKFSEARDRLEAAKKKAREEAAAVEALELARRLERYNNAMLVYKEPVREANGDIIYI